MIQEITIKNFRCFEELTIPFDEKLSVIVGVNGAGKTSVLEAVVIAVGTYLLAFGEKNNINIKKTDAFTKLFSLGDGIDVQPQFPIQIAAKGNIHEEDLQWSRALLKVSGKNTFTEAKEMTRVSQQIQDRMMNGDKDLILPLICYYSTARLWDYHRNRSNESRKNNRANGYLGCLDGTANVKQMLAWFEKMTVTEVLDEVKSPVFLAVKKAMEQCFSLMTGFQDVAVRYNYDTKEIDIVYTNENQMKEKKSIQYFSDGYKGTISLIADIAYRMALLNPMLGEEVLTKTEGIVLIDEIDLHLHPAWQQRILKDLTVIFPEIQFIVSSHAPSVINSVQSKNLIILDDHLVRPQSYQVYGKDVNSVLQEIMGVGERPEEVILLFQQFYDQIARKEFDQGEETLEELNQLLQGHDPEVASCKMKLKFERIRGG